MFSRHGAINNRIFFFLGKTVRAEMKIKKNRMFIQKREIKGAKKLLTFWERLWPQAWRKSQDAKGNAAKYARAAGS